MKYRLTCPACGGVVESPFVRVGAAVRCGGCQKVYRVGASMVSKQASPSPGSAKPASGGASDQLVIKNPGPPPRATGSGSVAGAVPVPGVPVGAGDSAMGASGIIGLSGLSEMMRQAEEKGGPTSPELVQLQQGKLPPGQSIVPTATSKAASTDPAAQEAHRRHRRLMFVLLALMALLVGLLGVAIAITASNSETDPTQEIAPGTPGIPGSPDTSGSIDEDVSG